MKTYKLTIMDGGEERDVLVENTDMLKTQVIHFAAQREGVSISCVLSCKEVKANYKPENNIDPQFPAFDGTGCKSSIEKYYYKILANGCCLEPCCVNNRKRIGSCSCQNCEHCKDYNSDERWIKCDIIKEALGEDK